MQYSPKLKKAMAEIDHIIKRYDIAAVVVLHTPGFCESAVRVSPSYSCARINGEEIRVRAKLLEDFSGDRAAWTEKVRDTSNMLHLLSLNVGSTALGLCDISDLVDETVKATHDPGSNTSHTTQNN